MPRNDPRIRPGEQRGARNTLVISPPSAFAGPLNVRIATFLSANLKVALYIQKYRQSAIQYQPSVWAQPACSAGFGRLALCHLNCL